MKKIANRRVYVEPDNVPAPPLPADVAAVLEAVGWLLSAPTTSEALERRRRLEAAWSAHQAERPLRPEDV